MHVYKLWSKQPIYTSEFIFVTKMLSAKPCVLIDNVAQIKGNVFVGAKEISREVLGVDKSLTTD